MRLIIYSFFLLLYPNMQQAQEKKYVEVAGKVTDNQGKPLPYASIICNRVSGGTSSDENGNYKLLVFPNSDITFSHADYEKYTTSVINPGTIHVQMRPITKINDYKIYLDAERMAIPVYRSKPKDSSNRIWTNVEISSIYPGNFNAYLQEAINRQLIEKKMQIPESIFQASIQINNKGRISLLHIRKGIAPAIDSIIENVITRSIWRPAIQNGSSCTTTKEIAIQFLNSKTNEKENQNEQVGKEATVKKPVLNMQLKQMDSMPLPKDEISLLVNQLLDPLDFSTIIIESYQRFAFGKTQVDPGYQILMNQIIGKQSKKYQVLYNLTGNRLRKELTISELKELLNLKKNAAGLQAKFLGNMVFDTFLLNNNFFYK